MPLIETKGAASAQGFGGAGAGASGPVTYIEDVFSTWLYQGTSANQTITNGIDLSTKGGLVWCKGRPNPGYSHRLFDTARGVNNSIATDSTAAQFTQTNSVTAFNTTGFSLGTDPNGEVNFSGSTYVGWTFRKQPKFFDVVTYTGNGVTGRSISHNLGSVPGCIIVRRYDTIAGWDVYHRSLGASQAINLQSTGAAFADTIWNSTSPTSTVFTVSGSANTSSGTYVAYLFAHNAGGFGLTGTDNVISCGSFTTDASGSVTVNLGYEPQWLLVKNTQLTENWVELDNMRGWSFASQQRLFPNLSNAEQSLGGNYGTPTATGFNFVNGLGNSNTYIYIAIRRGPMKVPTSGTSVFAPRVQTGEAAFNNSFPVDLVMERDRTSGALGYTADRLRGGNLSLSTTSTAAEFSAGPAYFDSASGTFRATFVGGASPSVVYENFGRAPGFFDVVCYTGDGVNTARTHNLGVVPELIIVKCRGTAGTNWPVYVAGVTGFTNWLPLNLTNALVPSTNQILGTSATTFTTGSDSQINGSSRTYVAYLFATCAGVSKVGSYTGTGALQTVNCGFTGGARFVLIKRTDSTGDWYVYDSARGISSGNDPYLFLNSTAAEVTGTNYVDTTSVGFQVTATAPAGLNANGGSFVFLAIA